MLGPEPMALLTLPFLSWLLADGAARRLSQHTFTAVSPTPCA